MLPALLIIPLVGALVLLFAPAERAKWISLVASTITLVISVIAAVMFGSSWGTAEFGLESGVNWLEPFGIGLWLGTDSVSLLLTLPL